MSSHHAAFPLKKEKISEYLYNSTANITPKAVGCCPLFFLPVLHLSPVRFHPRCTPCTALPVLHPPAPAALPAGPSGKIPAAMELEKNPGYRYPYVCDRVRHHFRRLPHHAGIFSGKLRLSGNSMAFRRHQCIYDDISCFCLYTEA